MDPQMSVETILPRLVPYVPGLPEPVALAALGDALRDFCRRAEVWRETIDVTVVADQEIYPLAAEMQDRGAVLLRVRQIRFDDADTAIGEEYYAVTEDARIVFDDPVPDDWGDVMNVDAVMFPDVDSRSAPAWLIRRWREVIADGAIAELTAQENRPWTSPVAAQIRGEKYRYGIGQAVMEALDERRSGALKAFPPTFV